ncbi:MAG: hypothetical protein ABI844_11735 [Saprospiraceae bacterium]
MYKFLLALVATNFLLCPLSKAQEKPREYSPYSRFGIGDLTDPNFFTISQFGGSAAGFTDRNFLNPTNPASLGALRNAAFEVGVSTKFNTLTSGQSKSTFFGGGLDYLALGLPLVNPINEALERKQRKVHIGTMFALKPFSQVGYDLQQIDSLEGVGRYSRKYTGNGGTYEFKWSTGFEFKSFSAGVGLGYLFGKMTLDRKLSLLDVPLPYTTDFQNEMSLKGFRWDLGSQYKINLRKLEDLETEPSKYISIGIYGQSSQPFSTTNNEIFKRELSIGTAGVSDTVKITNGVSGTGKLPGSINAGIYFNNDYKLQIAAQMSLVSWSQYKNSAKPDILKNTSNFSLGVAYTPNIGSFDNLLKRITYRAGLSVGNDPRNFNNEQLKKFTVTFGGSIPFVFQRKVSFANFAVEIGSLGIKDKLRSNFVQLKLGFTLNDDEWFIKRKYN